MIGRLVSIKKGRLSLRDFLLGAGADEEESGCEANDSECSTSSKGVSLVVALSLGVSLSERHGNDLVVDFSAVVERDASVLRCLCSARIGVLQSVLGNFCFIHDDALAIQYHTVNVLFAENSFFCFDVAFFCKPVPTLLDIVAVNIYF